MSGAEPERVAPRGCEDEHESESDEDLISDELCTLNQQKEIPAILADEEVAALAGPHNWEAVNLQKDGWEDFADIVIISMNHILETVRPDLADFLRGFAKEFIQSLPIDDAQEKWELWHADKQTNTVEELDPESAAAATAAKAEHDAAMERIKRMSIDEGDRVVTDAGDFETQDGGPAVVEETQPEGTAVNGDVDADVINKELVDSQDIDASVKADVDILRLSIESVASQVPLPEGESVVPVEGIGKSDSKHLRTVAAQFKEGAVNRQCLPMLIKLYIVFAIREGNYDARARRFLRRIAFVVGLRWSEVVEIEDSLARSLQEREGKSMKNMNQDQVKEKSKSKGRWWKVGLAVAVGGGLLAVTGGLAAPAIAAGLGALGASASAATIIGSTALVSSLFGASGASLAAVKMRKRTAGVDDFRFYPTASLADKTKHSSMSVVITVPGYIYDSKDYFVEDGKELLKAIGHGELYTLIWDKKRLEKIGKGFVKILESEAVATIKSKVIMETLKMTALQATLAALTWPLFMVNLFGFIDSQWAMLLDHADKAGVLLADVLIEHHQGHRPVTLIGFSLGARVIFKCLEELHSKGAHGIVENAFLIGAPVTTSTSSWENARSVVAGNLMNGYSRSDWVLAYLYRTMNLKLSVAGLKPVAPGTVFNVDLTNALADSANYRSQLLELLSIMNPEGLSSI